MGRIRHPNGVIAMSYAKIPLLFRARSLQHSVALLGSLAILAGCGGGTASPPGGGMNAATAGSGPNGTAGNGPNGTAGTTGEMLPPDGPCMPGIPVTTQIPRLLNRQYENVVRDLLGVTALDGAPVSSALIGDFTGPMTAPAWQIYQDVAAKIAAQVMAGPNKARFITCDPAAAGCLNTTIQSFGR